MNNSSGSNVNKHVDDKTRGITHDIKSRQNSNVDRKLHKQKSHKIRLKPPPFISVPQLNQESEQSCKCVLGVLK
jgi:hypothetical protein